MRFALVLSSYCGVAVAIQASNFNVSAETAAKYECGRECYRILQKTNPWDLEIVGTGYNPDFYATAANFSRSAPGDLLKLELVKPSHVKIPGGITTYRFQYASEDFHGNVVPVTGFMAMPYASPFGPKFRTIAFAHGTIGVFAGCAPSSAPDLYNYGSWGPIVQAGYAVVATDYAGLGNNATEHPYCVFPAHAQDVFYSVVAARQAFPDLFSEEWMSVGHSQGGGAAWKLGEMESNLQADCGQSGRYLGTVALAPASKIYNMAQDALGSSSGGSTTSSDSYGEVPWITLGIQRLLPSFDYALLGPVMRKRLELAQIAQTCYDAMMGLTLDLKLHELVSFSLKGLRYLERFQNMTAPAMGAKNVQPILIIQGLKDTSVIPKTTRDSWKASCNDGNELILKQYPGLDHTAVIKPAAPDWMSWINDRFEGKQTSGTCEKETIKPFDLKHMKTYSETGRLGSLVNI